MNEDKVSKVLFLCTGNYYRSRFAELYFNFLAHKYRLDWQTESRGFAPNKRNAGAISPFVIRELAAMKISSNDVFRMPLQVSEDDFTSANLVIALYDEEHRPLAERDFPAWTERIEFWKVPDVPLTNPETALPAIARQIEILIEKLQNKDSVSS